MDWTPEQLRDDFLCIAKLGKIEVKSSLICIQRSKPKHKPASVLPKGKIAVYIFYIEDKCVLKVGKAGPKSGARYSYQHYGTPKKGSTLAKSLLADEDAKKEPRFTKEDVGNWIKEKTKRVNFLLDDKDYGSVLSLFEAFVQCRLNPVYEGPVNQPKEG